MGQGMLNMHIIFESVLMLFTKNYQNQSVFVENTTCLYDNCKIWPRQKVSTNIPDQIHCQSFHHKCTETEVCGRHPMAPFLVADLSSPDDRNMQIYVTLSN